MSYVIISDSCCSLTEQEIKESGVRIIYLSFLMKDKESIASSEKDIKNFYSKLRKKENASTSCVNTQTFVDVFEEELKKGNDIISISLSSGLSATYQNSLIAKAELEEKYKDRKIVCFDSLYASYGMGMLVNIACMLKKQGKTLVEVIEFLNNAQLKTTALFTVDDLFYLYRGGRVKPSSYFIAKAINVKPLLHINNEGKLVAFGKTIGRKKALISLVEKMVTTIENPSEQIIYIGHGDCLDDVNFVIEQINKRIKVKDIKVSFIDPVIGVHSGPETLALFYFSSKRV